MLPNNGARSQERESSRSVSGPRGGGGHQGELLLTVRLDPYNMQDNCSGSGRGLGSEEQHRLQLQQPPTAAKGEKPELATHTHTQSRARATTNSARARFDSACCHTHTHLKQSSICTFFSGQVASPLAQFRTEQSAKDSVRCEAPSDTDVFASSEPRIPHSRI